jgi:hypothetical protein
MVGWLLLLLLLLCAAGDAGALAAVLHARCLLDTAALPWQLANWCKGVPYKQQSH